MLTRNTDRGATEKNARGMRNVARSGMEKRHTYRGWCLAQGKIGRDLIFTQTNLGDLGKS